jgi:hypothetical protein
MENIREHLELLLARAELVRDAQKEYFRQRNETNKRKAIALERQLDDVTSQLRRAGFNGDRFKNRTVTDTLF